MNNRYQTLSFIRIVLKVLAFIVLIPSIVSLLAIVTTIIINSEPAIIQLALAAYGVVFSAVLYIAGDILQLLLDIEKNTRRIAYYLYQEPVALSALVRQPQGQSQKQSLGPSGDEESKTVVIKHPGGPTVVHFTETSDESAS